MFGVEVLYVVITFSHRVKKSGVGDSSSDHLAMVYVRAGRGGSPMISRWRGKSWSRINSRFENYAKKNYRNAPTRTGADDSHFLRPVVIVLFTLHVTMMNVIQLHSLAAVAYLSWKMCDERRLSDDTSVSRCIAFPLLRRVAVVR